MIFELTSDTIWRDWRYNIWLKSLNLAAIAMDAPRPCFNVTLEDPERWGMDPGEEPWGTHQIRRENDAEMRRASRLRLSNW